MKIAVIIVRTLIGLLFILSGATWFLGLVPPPPPEMKGLFDAFTTIGYLLNFAKGVELICGIALVSGRYNTLALVLLAPVVINILIVNILFAPMGLVIVIPIVVGLLFLAYDKRENYRSLFVAK